MQSIQTTGYRIATPRGRLFARRWSPAKPQGVPFVLLHDSLGSVELWRDFPERLATATGRGVVAYDRLGFGRSDPHPGRLGPDFVHGETRGDFAHVREALGLERFIAFGYSVGGGMAVAIAAAYPDACVGLVTESAQAFVEDRTVEGILAAKGAFAAPGQVERLAKYHGDKARWVLDAWIETWLAPEFAGWNLDDELRRVRCPVLAIHGEGDEYGSMRHPERIASLAAGPATVVKLGCGHVPHREQAGEVLAAVRDWIAPAGNRPPGATPLRQDAAVSRFRILVIGAYGQFGRRIASTLARDDAFELVLAGRDPDAAGALAAELRNGAAATLSTAVLDVESAGFADELAGLRPDLVIHTAGPFQQRDYRVAEAALACDAHYVDLADGRGFVMDIDRLDARARARGRWVVSGASSVPGLSAAVVEAHRPMFARLDSVESAISPGNRTARGLATTQAILGYVGRPFRALVDGRWRDVHGWQSLRRIRVPEAGPRWVARCDVPELSVLPRRYPGLRHCDFRAGLELRRMHFGLWLASWLVRFRLMPGLALWARPLLRASELWMQAGSDTGAMTVTLEGRGHDHASLRLQWRIVATEGSGPQIPATAAVVLARKLARGRLPGGGARPCLDLFTLDEFMQALEGFPIRAVSEAPPAASPGSARAGLSTAAPR